MLTRDEKLKILEEILEGPDFKDSKRYQELLRYLVEQTLGGSVPKEIVIGMRLFGKDSGFDPKEDPTVRVYINNLRKKLEHYYLTVEKPFAYRLVIPKGHYQVEFEEVKQKAVPPTPPPQQQRWIWGAAIGATLILGFFIGFYSAGTETKRPPESNAIWREFMQPNGRQTLVLLGDFFFMHERADTGSGSRFIRDVNINTADDYRQLIRKTPALAKKLVQADFTFLRPSATWGLASILPFLQESPNHYSLKLASQFTVDDLKSHNIIFIGSFKSLFNLQKILHLFKIDYRLSPAGFQINGPDSVMFFSPTNLRGGNYERDHAIIAKAQGPENSTIILLTGFADTGVIEAARAIADPLVVERIQEKLPKNAANDPFNFTAVIESEGINQSIFKYTVRHVVPTSPAQPLKKQ